MNSFGGSGHESAGERVDSERLMAQVQQEMANQFAQVEGPRSALGEGGGGGSRGGDNDDDDDDNEP